MRLNRVRRHQPEALQLNDMDPEPTKRDIRIPALRRFSRMLSRISCFRSSDDGHCSLSTDSIEQNVHVNENIVRRHAQDFSRLTTVSLAQHLTASKLEYARDLDMGSSLDSRMGCPTVSWIGSESDRNLKVEECIVKKEGKDLSVMHEIVTASRTSDTDSVEQTDSMILKQARQFSRLTIIEPYRNTDMIGEQASSPVGAHLDTSTELSGSSSSKGAIIGGRRKKKELLGAGGCGQIYNAVDIRNGKKFILKSEELGTRSTIDSEVKVYAALKALSKRRRGFPELYFSGRVHNENVMVLSRHGPSLEAIMQTKYRRLSDSTVLQVGIQAIKRLQALHSVGYVHRDLKPEHFLVGMDDPKTVYLIDFGLSKKFRDTCGTHVRLAPSGFVSTLAFSSLNADMGFEQSRRDDLIALGYCLVYLLNGTLPWLEQTFSGDVRDEVEAMKHLKAKTDLRDLCPRVKELTVFLDYVSGLQFEETPMYLYLQRVFLRGLAARGSPDSCPFEWVRDKVDLELLFKTSMNSENVLL